MVRSDLELAFKPVRSLCSSNANIIYHSYGLLKLAIFSNLIWELRFGKKKIDAKMPGFLPTIFLFFMELLEILGSDFDLVFCSLLVK